jgi:hypothetical protein
MSTKTRCYNLSVTDVQTWLFISVILISPRQRCLWIKIKNVYSMWRRQTRTAVFGVHYENIIEVITKQLDVNFKRLSTIPYHRPISRPKDDFDLRGHAAKHKLTVTRKKLVH